VESGIKARSKRGEIAQQWWSRRFIEVLESFGMGGRLGRGRRYARAGQVLSLSVSTSLVTATVQGSRPNPYRVRIAVKAFTADEWATIEQALADQALFAAKLLAGELPTDIEGVFAELGLRLFPDTMRELTMDCSCPDWEVPCKHLAAVCYLLAESFDADPFGILAWRGRGRAELLDHLRALRNPLPRAQSAQTRPDHSPAESLDSFWTTPHNPNPLPDNLSESTVVTGAPDAVLDQLDPLPLTVGGQSVLDLLRPAYHALTATPDQPAEQ
jgi:uncharacterized Zn finger protein